MIQSRPCRPQAGFGLVSSKVLSYSFSKQCDPQNDLDMRPQLIIMIQKFPDILHQKVLIPIQIVSHVNNFFQVEQLKGGRTCSGDERGFRPSYNNRDKNSNNKKDDKNYTIIIWIIMTTFKNNHNNDNNKNIIIFWTIMSTTFQKSRQQQ